MRRSMLADQQYAEVVCVRLRRSPPDKKENRVECSSSDTVCGRGHCRLAGGRCHASHWGDTAPSRRIMESTTSPGESINVCVGRDSFWRPTILLLRMLPSLQHVFLWNASTSLFSRTKVPSPASVFVVSFCCHQGERSSSWNAHHVLANRLRTSAELCNGRSYDVEWCSAVSELCSAAM